MKKLLALILACLMVLSLVACGAEPAEKPADDGAANAPVETKAPDAPATPDSTLSEYELQLLFAFPNADEKAKRGVLTILLAHAEIETQE